MLTRLTLPGSLYLATVAVLPSIFIRYGGFSQATSRALGGTSVLIVVGVALDTMRQMESQMMMRSYEGFLKIALNILLLGPQGSGKGTQASGSRPSTGSRTSRPATCSARRSPPTRRSGGRSSRSTTRAELVPDGLMIELIRERLAEPDAARGLRARRLPAHDAAGGGARRDAREIGRELTVVFEFQLSEEICIERLLKRAP